LATIFALSSGAPPAAIAIIRISGPDAANAALTLAGTLPLPRRARRSTLHSIDGAPLDDALMLWFPGPASATGEDLLELHLHGGRAVVAAVETTLAALPGLRRAQPGEFTRRAFVNGRIDLAEAEGLADLLSAETELQRRAALAAAGGTLSRKIEGWRERVLAVSAQIEAALDFDEEDGASTPAMNNVIPSIGELHQEIERALAAPAAETLREGFRVALAGPPNAGKSTLFNALVGSEAAITTSIPGTTRDVLAKSVAIAGVPFTFIDMAGLHDEAADPVEVIGIARAHQEIARADLVLWLGSEAEGPQGSWEVDPQCDRADRPRKVNPRFTVSAATGQGLEELLDALVETASPAMPKPGEVALSRRQRMHLEVAADGLQDAACQHDLLLAAEGLRRCRAAIDALLGRTSTEDVLDALFGRFCIGK